MTTTTPPKPEPIEGPHGHKFRDAKMVERYLVKALCERDFEWAKEVIEDARIAFPADIARLQHKFGCDDYTVAVMLAPVQQVLPLGPAQEELPPWS